MRLILIIFIFFNYLSAVGEAGAIFLLISPGAGPQGTGEAQVAKVDDAYASYYNPAGFGFLKGREAVGMHVQWLPNLADDLFYEFLAYRHYIDGLGSVGGHLIFLNLGEQIGMDSEGNPTTNWSSFMAAFAGSFGTQLTPSSSIGFNFKIFHQKLADRPVEGEKGEGYSTDFGFDVGFLKKFKRTSETIKNKNKKRINHIFNKFVEYYDQQSYISDIINDLEENERNIYGIIDYQDLLVDEIGIQKGKLSNINIASTDAMSTNIESITAQMKTLIAKLNELNDVLDLSFEEGINSNTELLLDELITISEKISFEILDISSLKDEILAEIEEIEIEETDDKFNFGFCISNIGPKIDFVDADQADPSPMNMRMGIYTQLYNDGITKLNFLFDANKLLVSRYQMMDWDGDGYVGGFNKSGYSDVTGDYNDDGQKEYDSRGYFDDPWYLAIFTSWLDDWYFGGDIDHDENRKIGGWSCESGLSKKSNEEYECDGGWIDNTELDIPLDFSDTNYGVFGEPDGNSRTELEKGSGDDRSFSDELDNMIFNVGLEYWYSDIFALRAGYIYDKAGDVKNPTFGAGIRYMKYGFDFGYTAGEQTDTRANTMFFSINMEL